ncbi:hypothetical protein CK203_074711 [Vitis vinifera]|uniref:Uncharacterized protein n=1 Tax=Vitis vinifera TaxID=29760 RepID=A0A438DLY3_VITVI|nr:hypothetical protein CK203_074711 [Vitis vinifera]
MVKMRAETLYSKLIPADGFQAVSKLQILDLSGNSASLPDNPAFSSLPQLQELYLRRMQLCEVPSDILSFTATADPRLEPKFPSIDSRGLGIITAFGLSLLCRDSKILHLLPSLTCLTIALQHFPQNWSVS